MSTKYIGRTTIQKGKTIWEIVGNRKDYGIGRIIVRNQFDRYPEPSYFKIVKIATDDDVSLSSSPKAVYRKMGLTTERVFRGVKYDRPHYLYDSSYKPDYKMIPLAEEAKFISQGPMQKQIKKLSPYMQPPPLLQVVLARKWKSLNLPVLDIPMVYRKKNCNYYRKDLPEDNQEQTETFSKPVRKDLSENVLQ